MPQYPDCPACRQGLAWDGTTPHVRGCPEYVPDANAGRCPHAPMSGASPADVCLWAGTWQEADCNAPACPIHGTHAAPSDADIGRCPHGALAGFCTHEACNVRTSLHDDPFVSNADFGRLVEEAADADERRSWDAERDPDDGIPVPTADDISASYHAGDSLATMLAKFGTADATLRLIHVRIGVAMSTLRRERDDAKLYTNGTNDD